MSACSNMADKLIKGILGATQGMKEQAEEDDLLAGTSTEKLQRLMQDRHASHLMQVCSWRPCHMQALQTGVKEKQVQEGCACACACVCASERIGTHMLGKAAARAFLPCSSQPVQPAASSLAPMPEAGQHCPAVSPVQPGLTSTCAPADSGQGGLSRPTSRHRQPGRAGRPVSPEQAPHGQLRGPSSAQQRQLACRGLPCCKAGPGHVASEASTRGLGNENSRSLASMRAAQRPGKQVLHADTHLLPLRAAGQARRAAASKATLPRPVMLACASVKPP